MQSSDLKLENVGKIDSIYAGVGKITGLQKVKNNEVLINQNGNKVGFVVGFNSEYVEALFFDANLDIDTQIFGTGDSFKIPLSEGYLGRVVNGIGEAIDGLPAVHGREKSIFAPAPQIIDRAAVDRPLETGLKILDTTLPIGRGQRELIIGDRKTGKSTIAIDTIINQTDATNKVYSVYVLCGANTSELERVISILQDNDAFLDSVVVVAKSDDSLAEQYLAPLVGCTIAESFRDEGKDALIVYDNLSNHAKSYRDISLLLNRPPGRETYPGDIFTIHASLLERACQLSDKLGSGSLTALPIVDTQEGDITSFISTNLISISDGQIYLERGLMENGFVPAVNVGLSVSRIGSDAQSDILKSVTGGIRLSMAQHKQLQKLVQLETVMSKKTQEEINRGELILELLKQDKHINVTIPEQVILFYAVEGGFFDDISIEQLRTLEKLLLDYIKIERPTLIDEMSEKTLTEEFKTEINQIIKSIKLKL